MRWGDSSQHPALRDRECRRGRYQIDLRSGPMPKGKAVMTAIIRVEKKVDYDTMLLAYWLMFLRAPGKQTAPGEAVDLGEIGEAPEKNFERLTPYSLAKPIRS
jgi:hypothetical protein